MQRLLIGLAAATVLTGSALAANDFSVRGDLSGSWYNPEQSGHGLQIDVLDSGEAVIAWYLYDPDGQAMWLFGQGPATGNRITAELFRYSGGGFPDDFDADAVTGQAWGEVVIEFSDCERAELAWTPSAPGFEAGSLELHRLTRIGGVRCGQAEAFEQAVDWSLDAGPGAWQTLFSDYGEAQIGSMDREAAWQQLPEPLADRRGFRLAGRNTPDELAMLLAHPIGGLEPGTEYLVEADMRFATNVPRGCAGIGGAPGESVTIKLGAAGVEPEVVESDGFFRVNIDKGNQTQGGADALAVGDMTNSQGPEYCDPALADERRWELKQVSTRGETFTATSDSDGRLWVVGGTDSGFEGRTTIYFTDFSVRLMALD